MDLIEEHPLNDDCPNDVTDDGIITFCKELHSSKTESSIIFILEGISNSTSE